MDNFVSRRIKELCAEKGKSYYQLAQDAGCSTSSLYSILNGNASPKVSTLEYYCEALDISIEDFFKGYKTDRNDVCDVDELSVKISMLNNTNKKLLDGIAVLLCQSQSWT